jgi:type IV secretion system protein VirB10
MKIKNTLIVFLLPFFTLSMLWIGLSQESEPPSSIEEVVLPEGTVIPIILTDYLNTRSSQTGDVFYADTTYPIWYQQKLVIPKGSSIRGTITEVVRPGRIKGKGRLSVRFDDILLPNGVKQNLPATFRGIHGGGDESLDRQKETVTNDGSKAEDVGTVVGTASQGAILGAIVKGGTGAAMGAGIGAAAGTAITLFTRGRDLVITPGTRFDLQLKHPMKFARNELEFTASQIEGAQRDLRQNPAQNGSPSGSRGNTKPWIFPRSANPMGRF